MKSLEKYRRIKARRPGDALGLLQHPEEFQDVLEEYETSFGAWKPPLSG